MQPIERYGVVALLFLVATFTAVLVMGEGDNMGVVPGKQVLAKAPDAGPARAQRPKPNARAKAGAGNRVHTNLGLQPAPLARADFEAERLRQEAEEAERQRLEMERRILEQEHARELRRAQERKVRLAAAASGTPVGGFAPRGQAPKPHSEAALGRGERPQPKASGLRTYKVKSGDTLGEIALQKLGTSRVWKMICEVNPGLTASKLIVGRTIKLPSQSSVDLVLAKRSNAVPKGKAKGSKKPALKSPSSVASAAAVTYTVREGESLWRIAERQLGNGARFQEIVQLNPKIDPNRLRVGQKLQMPRASKAPRSSAPIAKKVAPKSKGRVR